MASYVVTELAELQVHMEPIVNFDMDHYRMLHQRLIEHEELIFGTSIQVQVWRHSFLQEYFSLLLLYMAIGGRESCFTDSLS